MRDGVQAIRIVTRRFLLRPLTRKDVTARYLEWFAQEDVRRHIVSARQTTSLAALCRYLADRTGRDDILFLGIFTRRGRHHVGNVKYEPLNAARRYAVMGILVGERRWRGRGVAEEAILASARWLRDERGIRDILLGVSRDHPAAIAAYRKIGFRVSRDRRLAVPRGAVRMRWRLALRPASHRRPRTLRPLGN